MLKSVYWSGCLVLLMVAGLAGAAPAQDADQNASPAVDLAAPIPHDDDALVLGTWSEGTIYAEDVARFGEFSLEGWPVPIEEYRMGIPDSLNQVLRTFVLMNWNLNRAKEYGVLPSDEWEQRQYPILSEATGYGTRNKYYLEMTGGDLEAAAEERIREEVEEFSQLKQYWFQALFLDTSDDYLQLGPGEEFQKVREKQKAAAEKALALLREGQPWKEVVFYVADYAGPQHVVGPVIPGTAQQPGKEVDEVILDALQGLEANEFTEVLENRFGFLVLRVDNVEPVSEAQVEAYRSARLREAMDAIYMERHQQWQQAKIEEMGLEIETHPERIAISGGDPEAVIVAVRSLSEKVEPYEYTVRDFQDWAELKATPSEIADIVDIEEGKQAFLDLLVDRGVFTVIGRAEGLDEDPRVRMWAAWNWRALVADEVMEAVAKERTQFEELTEEDLLEHYNDNLNKYSTAGQADILMVKSLFHRVATPRGSDRGFAKKATQMMMDGVMAHLEDGQTPREAVRKAREQGPPVPAEAIAERAMEVLGEDATVWNLQITEPEEYFVTPATMVAMGFTNPNTRTEILSATPEQEIGPFPFWVSQPGELEEEEGFAWVKVLDAQAPETIPFSEAREEVWEELQNLNARRARSEIQQNIIQFEDLNIDSEAVEKFVATYRSPAVAP